jgi:hypothetical protein
MRRASSLGRSMLINQICTWLRLLKRVASSLGRSSRSISSSFSTCRLILRPRLLTSRQTIGNIEISMVIKDNIDTHFVFYSYLTKAKYSDWDPPSTQQTFLRVQVLVFHTSTEENLLSGNTGIQSDLGGNKLLKFIPILYRFAILRIADLSI